jgi:hypothetical protein
MKVTEYQGAGLYPLVMPWSHLNRSEPGLTMTFTTAGELAERIDWVASHWEETEKVREANREFAEKHYHIHESRRIFRSLLEEVFGADGTTS